MCEGCVDICPWKCIHMVKPEAIVEAIGTERPGEDPSDEVFTIDDDICNVAHCASTAARPASSSRQGGHPGVTGDTHTRTNNHGYAYGMRF